MDIAMISTQNSVPLPNTARNSTCHCQEQYKVHVDEKRKMETYFTTLDIEFCQAF